MTHPFPSPTHTPTTTGVAGPIIGAIAACVAVVLWTLLLGGPDALARAAGVVVSAVILVAAVGTLSVARARRHRSLTVPGDPARD